MIRTLAPTADPVTELKRRLRFLEDVEVPMLRAEWGEPGFLGIGALRDYSEREMRDAGRLLGQLAAPLDDLEEGERVRLNDCVALLDPLNETVEQFLVHAPGLVIRAPGYIAADTALGAAVLGRQLGDSVQVEALDGDRTYIVQRIRRSQ